MNLKRMYNSIIKKSGIEDREYAKDFLTNPIYQNPKLPIVLGAGTSSGKTVMAILKLIMFYLNPKNKNKQCLVIPAFQEILRDNFVEQLKEIRIMYGVLPFTYKIIKGKNSKQQLKEAIDSGINVIICLPTTINNNSNLFKNKIEWLYFDEAHYFYLAKMCQDLVKKIKPKYQLLMTGSVAKYNADSNNFIMKYVPVAELHRLGLISNPRIELIQSSYDLKDTDYKSMFGNLKNGKTNSKTKNIESLYSVAKGMVDNLKSKYKFEIGFNTKKYSGKKAIKIYGDIDKTIMICHSIPQAKCFYNILSKELKNKVLISHSETDREDWDNFKKFKTDDNKLLIVVNQGRIGYSMKELFNIVDFSMSKDFEIIQQIVGRLLRISDKQPDKQKIYYKVSTTDLAKWYEYVMRCVMCLMHLEWYSTYTGNKKQFKFPYMVRNLNQPSNKTKSNLKTKSNNKFKISDEFPLDLDYVNYVEQNMKSDFTTYAWWNMEDVLKYEMNKHFISFNEARDIVRSFGLKNQNDWKIFSKTERTKYNIPSQPEKQYKSEWISFHDFIGTKPGFTGKTFLSFEEARSYVHKFNLSSKTEWYGFCKTKKPYNIPYSPNKVYPLEWKGWGDFLGTNVIAAQDKVMMSISEAKKWIKSKKIKTSTEFNRLWKEGLLPDSMPKSGAYYYKISWPEFLENGNDKKFLSFNKAKTYVRSLNIKTFADWHIFSRSERPKNIPSNPQRTFSNNWKGWEDFLGNKK